MNSKEPAAGQRDLLGGGDASHLDSGAGNEVTPVVVLQLVGLYNLDWGSE